ncbi:MAG: DUF4278 domain-containing protein [Microcoleaceae cyanobacterium]
MSRHTQLTYRGISYAVDFISTPVIETRIFAKYRGLAYNVCRSALLSPVQSPVQKVKLKIDNCQD